MDPNTKEGYTVIDDEGVVKEPTVWIELEASVANDLNRLSREQEYDTVQGYLVNIIEKEDEITKLTNRLESEGVFNG